MIKTACPTTLNLPYSDREIKIAGFGGRPLLVGGLGPWAPWAPLNPALGFFPPFSPRLPFPLPSPSPFSLSFPFPSLPSTPPSLFFLSLLLEVSPQTKIFSHQCGGHLQPVGVKLPKLPSPTNRTLVLGNLPGYRLQHKRQSATSQKPKIAMTGSGNRNR